MKVKLVALVVAIAIVATGIGLWVVISHKHNKQQASEQGLPAISLNVAESDLLLSQDKKSFKVAVKSDKYNEISRVEYLVDNTFVTYSTHAPFEVTIDITKLSLGEHTLQAKAYNMQGKSSKSAVFTFTIIAGMPVGSADEPSQDIVKESTSIESLVRSVRAAGKTSDSTASGSSSNNSGGDSGNNGGNNGGGNDTTPWPDTPAIAQICSNTSLLSGPSSAPAGAITVPAGIATGIDLEQNNKVYWFAPGVHFLGSDPFNQIEPGTNSTYVGAPGAILDGQGINQYAFTQHATNVKIQYLTITNFNGPRDEGVVNHDSGVGWTMEYNTLYNNAGGAMFAGSDNVVRYNCLRDNGQYGFQVYSSDPGGPHNVLLDHNEVSGNNTDDWETQINGCGCTGGGKFWEATNVTVTNNYVHDNLSVGLWADTNDNDFLVEGNYISGNRSQGLFYEISYNMIVRNNNFVHNAWADGIKNNSFPTGAIYLSEAGGDGRVPGRTALIDIYDNNFDDNWAGVILWENADRYCHSPANTSSGTCTMVNPAANLTTCNDPALGGSINSQPYKSDCRWKTQNVKVHNNIFKSISASITGCITTSSCGYQGIFSNVGTFPSWSPYMGSGIQTAITFNQNNLFSSNTYLGDWRYKAKDQSTNYNFAFWQLAPISQDTGSTYNGQSHLVIDNALDSNTATLEGGLGQWSSWFSTTASSSTEQAHSGTHSLKVTITAPFGWGVNTTDSDGFPVTPGAKNISYWARLGSGTNLKTNLEVKWLDDNGNVVDSATNFSIPSDVLTTDWKQYTITKTPPAGAKAALIDIVNASGAAGTTGNIIYMDDFIIGDAQ